MTMDGHFAKDDAGCSSNPTAGSDQGRAQAFMAARDTAPHRPETPIDLPALHPCMTISVGGDNYQGFLVIDSILRNRSAGGVRIAADLPLDEVAQLAREMTLKYSLFRLPRGGAKAGMRILEDVPRHERLRALNDFGAKLGPVIRQGIYMPGMDMNCGPEELRAIYRGAGLALGQLTDTSYFTALGATHAILACARESQALSRKPLTLAIEGFGSVARHLAEMLPAGDFRIVSVATVLGAVENADGYPAETLSRLKTELGDNFVEQLPGKHVTREAVLTADVDILVPSSRTGALTPEIATRLRARCVVPVANAPYAASVVGVLHGRGILCLPGYVTNVGGVLGSSLHDLGVPDSDVEEIFSVEYERVIAALIGAGRRYDVSPCDVAERLARTQALSRSMAQPEPSIGTRVYERAVRRRLPGFVRGRLARRTSQMNLRALAADLEALTEK